MSLAQRVADRWEEDGVAWDAGADAELLDEAERVHGVQLPPSFRELWRLRDGTTAPDRHWLIFMQASDLAQPLYATRGPEGVALIFADWRQGTALALRLGPEDRGVVRIEDAPRLLAASFDAFLETYLREAPDDFTQLLREERRRGWHGRRLVVAHAGQRGVRLAPGLRLRLMLAGLGDGRA